MCSISDNLMYFYVDFINLIIDQYCVESKERPEKSHFLDLLLLLPE